MQGDQTGDLSFLQPSTQPDSIGRLGGYEIQSVIHRGGHSSVLAAFDVSLQQKLAIKAMMPKLATDPLATRRFFREAQISAAIRHDNVISIHAIEEQPIPFLVMEPVAGRSLYQTLNQDGPFDIEQVIAIGSQLASGLAAIHAREIVHCDLHPGNLLLDQERNQIKIIDFGLARLADDVHLTKIGYVIGMPAYMSPEAAMGEVSDPRSDLFSLGSVLYAMCAGRSPFHASRAIDILKGVTGAQPRPLKEINPKIPDSLIAIINRLLEKQPSDRFASAEEVVAALSRCRSSPRAGPPQQTGWRATVARIGGFFRSAGPDSSK